MIQNMMLRIHLAEIYTQINLAFILDERHSHAKDSSSVMHAFLLHLISQFEVPNSGSNSAELCSLN